MPATKTRPPKRKLKPVTPAPPSAEQVAARKAWDALGDELTVAQIVAHWRPKVSVSGVYRWIKEGLLPAKANGATRYVAKIDFERFIAANQL